jgi:hypothetical protein
MTLNHQANTYLTVTLQSASPFISQPSLLQRAHPSLIFAGPVAQLEDVKLFSVPKAEWEQDGVKEDIFTKLLGESGVESVEVLPEPVKRKKRDEF